MRNLQSILCDCDTHSFEQAAHRLSHSANRYLQYVALVAMFSSDAIKDCVTLASLCYCFPQTAFFCDISHHRLESSGLPRVATGCSLFRCMFFTGPTTTVCVDHTCHHNQRNCSIHIEDISSASMFAEASSRMECMLWLTRSRWSFCKAPRSCMLRTSSPRTSRYATFLY